MSNDNVITLPVVRRMNAAPVSGKPTTAATPATQMRRIAVELDTTPENWKRLEKLAWDNRRSVGEVMALIVAKNLEFME